MSIPTEIAALDQKASDTLRRLGDRLPVRPGPLLDLLACSGEEAREVTQIIERDPALTARVLGVVNSAGNRRLNEITCLSRAILQLGPVQVRSLGLAMGLQVLAEQMALSPEMVRAFWNASLRKAEAAHVAAQAIDPDRQSSAYSAGLIADLGLPLLMGLDPDFYENQMPLRPAAQSWIDAERQHFGIDHAQAGAHVLKDWKVSAETCRRVRMHHQLPSDDDDAGLVLSLFIASLLPHDDGEIDPGDLDRLMAVHGKVLSHAYASPDAFLGHVYVESQRRLGRDIQRDSAEGLELQPFLDAIASNTIHLVSQLTAIKNKQSKNQEDLSNLRFEAFTDPLTKVLNRRGFFSLAEQRFAKAAEQGMSACCMMIDMNGFKPINDQYGHDAGDLMLRGMAKLLRRSVSRSDLIGRLGGDEFAVLITDIDEHGARVAATRLRDTCLHRKVRVAPDVACEISFSLGAVFHETVGLDVQLDQLMAGADELMYQRKRSSQPGMIFARFGHGNGDSTMAPVIRTPDA